MKVIFLDVDGVLNNASTNVYTPKGYIGVDKVLLNRLLDIIKETNAVIVLTSSWKYDDEISYLYEKLGDNKPIDVTIDPEERQYRRGAGILDYINNSNIEIEEFVIIDDYSFDFSSLGLFPHCVLTDESIGLSEEDVKTAIDILNGKLIPNGFYEEKFNWGYHR